MHVRAALAVSVVIAVGAACAGDEPPPSPLPTTAPPTAAPPTTTASATTPGATPTPPALPAAARQDSPAGAEAFARHWLAALDYAYTTRRHASPSGRSAPARSCRAQAGGIDRASMRPVAASTAAGSPNSSSPDRPPRARHRRARGPDLRPEQPAATVRIGGCHGPCPRDQASCLRPGQARGFLERHQHQDGRAKRSGRDVLGHPAGHVAILMIATAFVSCNSPAELRRGRWLPSSTPDVNACRGQGPDRPSRSPSDVSPTDRLPADTARDISPAADPYSCRSARMRRRMRRRPVGRRGRSSRSALRSDRFRWHRVGSRC